MGPYRALYRALCWALFRALLGPRQKAALGTLELPGSVPEAEALDAVVPASAAADRVLDSAKEMAEEPYGPFAGPKQFGQPTKGTWGSK